MGEQILTKSADSNGGEHTSRNHRFTSYIYYNAKVPIVSKSEVGLNVILGVIKGHQGLMFLVDEQ